MRQQQLSVGFTEICTVIAFKKVEGIMGMSNILPFWIKFISMASMCTRCESFSPPGELLVKTSQAQP